MSGLSNQNNGVLYRAAQVMLNFGSVVAEESRNPRVRLASPVLGAVATVMGRAADQVEARPLIVPGGPSLWSRSPIDQGSSSTTSRQAAPSRFERLPQDAAERRLLSDFNDVGGGLSRSMSRALNQGGFRV